VIITTHRCSGTRIAAKAAGVGLRVVYDFHLTEAENHVNAATILAKRQNWSGTWHSASHPNGTFCHILAESAVQSIVLPMA
jgi:hypothetical protein